VRWAARGEGGQASVELALALPLVFAMLFAVVQLGLVVRDQVLLVHAAREAVRELAVAPQPGGVGAGAATAPSTAPSSVLSADLAARARHAAAAATGDALDPARLTVTVELHPGTVAVRARYDAPFTVPFLDVGRRFVRLMAYAEMQREAD
jgi:Flp pilus assembly protein TadG